MEYNLTKKPIGLCSRFLDTVNEQLVDADITLPDYCPDIEKILRCTITSGIHNRNISGGQLLIEGTSVVRILYCDSVRHNVRSFEQTVPFTSTFNLKSTPEQYVVLADTKCEYVNCRALSPRKLVIHGAFSLYVKVLSRETIDCYTLEEDCDLRCKMQDMTVSDMTALCQEQFSVSEDISITDKAPVESLLTYDVDAHITDIKSIRNKVMLNAELTLRVMYLSDIDTGAIEHLSYAFPVSRIIDCDGISEESVNVPYLDVMSYDLHIRNDSMNDGSQLSLDVRLCYCEIGYTETDLSVIDDVYSTEYMVDVKHTSSVYESEPIYKDLTFNDKSVITLDNTKIKKVIDIYSESLALSPVIAESKLKLSGKANICMLIETDSDTPMYVERAVELEFIPDTDKTFSKAELCCSRISGISFRLVDDSTIELRIRVGAGVLFSNIKSVNPVTGITTLEDKPVQKDEASLVLYFADSGEEIWGISKSFYTDPKLIKSENSLDNDTLDVGMMLMIPVE